MATRRARFARGWLAAVATGALIAAASVLGLAAPAQAHDWLVSSVPQNGSVLTELPTQFSVTTNEVLLDLGGKSKGFAMRIQGPDGLYYGDGCVAVRGPAISTDAALGGAGKYTIDWQLISTDGHSASGALTFTWQPASSNAPVSTGAKNPPDCHGTTAAGTPAATAAAPSTTSKASLADILWIGGAIVFVGLAILITLLVLSRGNRNRKAET